MTKLVLARRAPWNPSLRDSRTRYVQAPDGRRYTAEYSGALWTVYECDEQGLPPGWEDDPRAAADRAFVAIAPNLPRVRVALAMHQSGENEDAIRAAMFDLSGPSGGTGRNAPANVARRRAARRIG